MIKAAVLIIPWRETHVIDRRQKDYYGLFGRAMLESSKKSRFVFLWIFFLFFSMCRWCRLSWNFLVLFGSLASVDSVGAFFSFLVCLAVDSVGPFFSFFVCLASMDSVGAFFSFLVCLAVDSVGAFFSFLVCLAVDSVGAIFSILVCLAVNSVGTLTGGFGIFSVCLAEVESTGAPFSLLTCVADVESGDGASFDLLFELSRWCGASRSFLVFVDMPR